MRASSACDVPFHYAALNKTVDIMQRSVEWASGNLRPLWSAELALEAIEQSVERKAEALRSAGGGALAATRGCHKAADRFSEGPATPVCDECSSYSPHFMRQIQSLITAN